MASLRTLAEGIMRDVPPELRGEHASKTYWMMTQVRCVAMSEPLMLVLHAPVPMVMPHVRVRVQVHGHGHARTN